MGGDSMSMYRKQAIYLTVFTALLMIGMIFLYRKLGYIDAEGQVSRPAFFVYAAVPLVSVVIIQWLVNKDKRLK
jgi:surface polysaccharide O-acyltransferase-like enzyme